MYTMPIIAPRVSRGYQQPNFKAKMSKVQISEVRNEVQTSIEPFIAKNTPIVKKGEEILRSVEDKLAIIPKFYAVQKFVPQEIVLRDERIERIAIFAKNQEEFDYLAKKSQYAWAGEDAQTYAWLLNKVGLFKTPKFLEPAMNAFKKFEKDSKNGLQNMTMETISPKLYSKASKLEDIKKDTTDALETFYDVKQENLELKALLAKEDSEESFIECILSEIRKNMDSLNQKASLANIIDSAERIDKEISITDDDKVVLNNIYKPANQAISRNMNKLKAVVEANPISEIQAEQLSEIIAQQKVELKNLWNKIEEGKMKHFSKIEKGSKDRSAAYCFINNKA